jgi:ABC-type protease/lipase transport system fused ATPase/permease subunit
VTAPLTSANPLREALGRGKGILVVAFGLSFVFNLLSLAGPIFMLLIFDRVLPSRSEETLVALFALVVFLLAALVLIDYSRRRLLARFGARFQEQLEDRMFDGSSKAWQTQRSSRKPVPGLDDLDAVRGFFHSGAMIAVLDVFWAPMFLLAIFVLHPGLGLLALTGIGLLVGIAVARWVIAGGREERLRLAKRRIGSLQDMAATGRSAIRSQEMSAGYRSRWIDARRQARDRSLETRDMTTWFSVGARQVQGLARYAVLAAGAWLTLQGELTIGAMVAATFLAQRAINPLDSFLDEAPVIVRSMSHWSDLRAVLSNRGAAVRDGAAAAPAGAPTLALQRVTVRSPVTGATVLNTISFSFPSGSITEITGQSGSGKTLLAETLLGLTPATSGHVLYNGVPIQQVSPAIVARAFGYVSETADFVTGTIAENIARLDPEIDQEAIVMAARLARVHDFIIGLPEAYDTRLEATERKFSLGQRNQIALARALYGSPDLLVIDDPEPVIRRLLKKDLRPALDAMKARGAAVIILAREPIALPNATQVATLEAGRLKAVVPEVPAAEDAKVSPLIRK